MHIRALVFIDADELQKHGTDAEKTIVKDDGVTERQDFVLNQALSGCSIYVYFF